MPRPARTLRTVQKNIALPEDLAAKLELHLYSEVEGRVPFGAQSAFFSQLLTDYFNQKQPQAQPSLEATAQ